MWQNSRTQNLTKVKNFKCDKNQKIKMWQKSKNQNVTKLKNSNFYKTQKVRLWQNSKSQMLAKLKKSNCDKTKKKNIFDKNQKLKLWQYLRTQIGRNLNLWRKKKLEKGLFIKNNLTTWQSMRCTLGSVLRFSQCFVIISLLRYFVKNFLFLQLTHFLL